MPPKTRTAEKSSRSDPSSLSSARKAVVIGVAAAVVFLGASFYIYNQFVVKHLSIPHVHSLTDRITFTLRHQALGLFVVALSLVQVAFILVWTPALNPLYDAAFERANRFLTNTVEHLVVSSVNQLVLATFLSEDRLKLIPLINFYFLFGRLVLWVAAQTAPKYQSFGLLTTLIPNVAIAGYNLFFFLTTNPTFLFDAGARTFGRMS